ncbi:MAG TPA: hypothetical protein VFP95_06390, partial [Gammaproteobacteria bacterium]|nr:hypothetical protein [Gammaproteobacteria bacterium]
MRLHRFVFIISIFWAGFGIAADCPPGRDQVSVRIIPSVHQDTATGLFVYRYIVESSSASRQEVDRFAVDYVGKLSQIRQPEG